MKNVIKFVIITTAVFTAVVGALIVVDKLLNRNRIKSGYLDCDIPEEECLAE